MFDTKEEKSAFNKVIERFRDDIELDTVLIHGQNAPFYQPLRGYYSTFSSISQPSAKKIYFLQFFSCILRKSLVIYLSV